MRGQGWGTHGFNSSAANCFGVSVLVRRRILFAAVWLGRIVCRVARGLSPTFLFFGSAISGGRGLLVARSMLLNLWLGTTGHLGFRLGLACRRRHGSSSSRGGRARRD